MFILLFSACFNNAINTEKIDGSPPQLNLLTPEEGEQFFENTPIEFSALIQDQTNPPDTLLISWTSSVDGGLL